MSEKIPWETRQPEELPYYVPGEFAGIIPTPGKVNSSIPGEKTNGPLQARSMSCSMNRKYLTPEGCRLQNRYLLALWREASRQEEQDKYTVDGLQWEARTATNRCGSHLTRR